MRRDQQAAGVQDAKTMASRLRAALAERGVAMSHGESLDLVARSKGHRDWNTLKSVCERDTHMEPHHSDAATRLLGLDRQDPKEIANRVCFLTLGADLVFEKDDMWVARAVRLIDTLSHLLVDLSRTSGTPLHPAHVLRGLQFETGTGWKEAATRGDPMSLIQLYCWSQSTASDEVASLKVKGFFDTLPGFDHGKALRFERQEVIAMESYGLLAMIISKPLGELLTDLRTT